MSNEIVKIYTNEPRRHKGSNASHELQANQSPDPIKCVIGNRSASVDPKNYFPLVCQSDPYRARFIEIANPTLRLLRARKLPPKEREIVESSLFDQYAYLNEMP